MQPPATGDLWVGLTDGELPIAAAYQWSVLPRCGAAVLFSGTVRDHATDDHGELRTDVAHLDYEAYDEQVVPAFTRIADEVRRRWPGTGRIVLLHRIGRLELTESSVVVVVSSPHRPEAFDAARFAIDALKAGAPIWKRESWGSGDDDAPRQAWGLNAHQIVEPGSIPTAGGR